MYAMPVNSGVQALIYNTEVYKKAGLDPEKPPKTFAELLETAGKIADFGKGEIWGHYLLTAPTSQTGSDYFTSVLWAFGGKEVNEDSTKVVFNSPEGVEALSWYKSMFARKVMPIKQVNETQMLQDYLTGNVGSMGATPALLANVSAASFKSASVRLPAGPKSQTATIGFGTIMVMDKAKNREAGLGVCELHRPGSGERRLLEHQLRAASAATLVPRRPGLEGARGEEPARAGLRRIAEIDGPCVLRPRCAGDGHRGR